MSKYEQLFSDVRKELNETRKELDAKMSHSCTLFRGEININVCIGPKKSESLKPL